MTPKEAIEDLIQALMKLPSEELDVKQLAIDWLTKNIPDPHSSWNVDFYEKAFLAGFEAGRKADCK